MRTVLALIAAVAVSVAAVAQDQTIALFADEALIVPAESPLGTGKVVEEGMAAFPGKILLTGTYYYGDGEFNDGPGVELELAFFPDKASWAKLPRLKLRGQPQAIYLRNDRAFAKAVVPPSTLARLKRDGNAGYVTGKAAIWVDRFHAGVECDGPSYFARFVSLQQPVTQIAMGPLPASGC